ncbi:hypothetical protein [Leptospira alstonii]|nr:hypothetical protein [Leptospira alstonii]
MVNKEQLELFRIALISGYIQVSSVIDWADSKIQNGSDDYIYIEIATTYNINDMVSVLRQTAGEFDPQKVVRGFLGVLYNHYKNNPSDIEKIVRTLYQILLEFESSMTDNERGTIYQLDDGYDLASQGIYGSMEEVSLELGAFLNEYFNEYESMF